VITYGAATAALLLTRLVSADVPTGISDRDRLYIGLVSSRKPIVTRTFGEVARLPPPA